MSQFLKLSEDEQDEFVKLYYDRFAGRLEFYSIRREGGDKAAYIPSDHEMVKREVRDIGDVEFTENVVRAHLEGRHLIGAYCINSDSNVNWFSFDFDGKNGDPWAASVQQAKVLKEEAGLTVYIERSQSGNGYHVWGFLDEAVNAGKVRHALAPFIDDVDVFDRMYPVQSAVTEAQPKGNLIALPLHGGRLKDWNTAFVKVGTDGQPVPFQNQIECIRKIKLNAVEIIEKLFEEAGDYVPQREITTYAGEGESLGKSWKMTHPVFGCDFWRQGWENPEEISEPLWYAMACNLAQLEDGRELFHKWSARDARYNARHTDKKYDQALRLNKPHGCETIRAIGGDCRCDERFPGKVYHPFDIVKQPISALLESINLDEETASASVSEGFRDVKEWLIRVQEDPTLGKGIPTSIKGINKFFGYRDGELTTLAARNSIGKTAYTLQEAILLALNDRASVKYYSLEMQKRAVFARTLSTVSGVTQTRMATGMLTDSDWRAINDAIARVESVDFVVDDVSSHLDTILESIAQFALSRQAKGKKVVVFVDYLQIIPRMPRENEQDSIARCITALKRMSKALDIHIVVLCQLNRGADDATTESKTYDSWLRGSGVIEFVSDNIQIILGDKGPGVVERTFTQHKQKNGEAGITIVLEFNQPLMSWADEGAWGVTMADPANREDGDEYPDVPEEMQPHDFSEFNATHAELVEGL